jgi:hypothetical protein
MRRHALAYAAPVLLICSPTLTAPEAVTLKLMRAKPLSPNTNPRSG